MKGEWSTTELHAASYISNMRRLTRRQWVMLAALWLIALTVLVWIMYVSHWLLLIVRFVLHKLIGAH